MAHTPPLLLLLLFCFCRAANGRGDCSAQCPTMKNTVSQSCERVLSACLQGNVSWTRCFTENIVRCTPARRRNAGFIFLQVDPSNETEIRPTNQHGIRMPSSALQRAGGPDSREVLVVATVLDSAHFKPQRTKQGRRVRKGLSGKVLGGTVLVLHAGQSPLQNLPEPITLTFKHNKTVRNGTCVFWKESNQEEGTGDWSTYGCNTSDTGSDFVCRCNHLSFFAVLVNPDVSLSKEDAFNLSLITYVGSALSVFFTIFSLIIYVCLHKQHPEKAVSLHMHLTAALLCLHLSFLLCSFWAWRLKEDKADWFCRALGLLLHWSLLATVSWSALEGFHLYLLLVRVFNIYIRRYLLKLSVVGWGLPTLITLLCGVCGVYGKHKLKFRDANNHTSSPHLCWISSDFPHRQAVTYVTTVAFPCLVVIFNSCMLGLVVFKLWRLRGGGWEKSSKGRASRLCKDCMTVLGLSCVLGLPMGLSSASYISLPGIYVFTTLNSLQGVFVFLWSLALTCKSRTDATASSGDTSSQRIITTSFNS